MSNDKMNYIRLFYSFCTTDYSFCKPTVYLIFEILNLDYKSMSCKNNRMSHAKINHTIFLYHFCTTDYNFRTPTVYCYLQLSPGLPIGCLFFNSSFLSKVAQAQLLHRAH